MARKPKTLRPQEILLEGYQDPHLTPREVLDRHAMSVGLRNTGGAIVRTIFKGVEVSDPYGVMPDSLTAGSSVIIASHRGKLDIAAIALAFHNSSTLPAPKPPYFIAKAEMFGVPEGVESKTLRVIKRVSANVWSSLGGIPYDRSPERMISSAKYAATIALCALEEGHSVVVFPEGTYGEGDMIKSYGALGDLIARRGKVPLVPCGIAGTEGAIMSLARGVRPAVTIHFGQPFAPDGHKDSSLARLQDAFNAANLVHARNT